jgi:hypothetical protein
MHHPGAKRAAGMLMLVSFRHCEERQRRSNPDYLRGDTLDCFASLAMTEWLFDMCI